MSGSARKLSKKSGKKPTAPTKKEISFQRRVSTIRSQVIFDLAAGRRPEPLILIAKKKERSADEIYEWLCEVLKVGHINTEATTTDYIKGDDPVKALRAFAAVLNNSSKFSKDGLDLAPGDLGGAKKMKHVGGAIVSWYLQNGWIVS